jgi:hypothetical protein
MKALKELVKSKASTKQIPAIILKKEKRRGTPGAFGQSGANRKIKNDAIIKAIINENYKSN